MAASTERACIAWADWVPVIRVKWRLAREDLGEGLVVRVDPVHEGAAEAVRGHRRSAVGLLPPRLGRLRRLLRDIADDAIYSRTVDGPATTHAIRLLPTYEHKLNMWKSQLGLKLNQTRKMAAVQADATVDCGISALLLCS